MPLKVFPLAPYYDDFNQEKNYQRILFKPGYSVQARELTQLQTSIQAQIDRFGRHVFKDGSSVIGGEASLDSSFAFIKIESTFSIGSTAYDSDVQSANKNFVGRTLTGQYTGITATVIDSIPFVDASNPLTLYVQYTSSNTNVTANSIGVDKTFYANEVLEISRTPTETLASDPQIFVKVKTATSIPVGKGTRVTVSEGVFFVSGNFVYTPQSSVILAKYNGAASGRIVYVVTEGVVTAAAGEAESLFDNSIGTPNASAPGADRYQISLDLQVQPYQFADRTENNIIQLMVIKDGKVVSKARTSYSEIGDILAQRTFEESGNYTVRPFQINVRQYLNENANGGLYSEQQITSSVSAFRLGNKTAAEYGEERLAVGLEPSVAYVNGYRVELLDTKYVEIPKARETATLNGVAFNALVGNYVLVQLDGSGTTGQPDINSFAQFNLIDAAAATIGTARARALEATGTSGTYKLYLFDVNLNSGKTFSEVRKFGNFAITAGSVALQDTVHNSLVFKLPLDVVDDVSNVSYDVFRQYDVTAVSGVLTLAPQANETFDTETTPIVLDSTGAVKAVSSTSGNIVISLVDTSVSGTCRVYARTRSTRVQKTKTLTVVNFPYATALTREVPAVSLGVTDLFEIINIFESPNSSTPATTSHKNITSDFIIDNGQRDNFYDFASVRLKTTANIPGGQLLIQHKHFAHGVNGGYFTRNSYSIDYSAIPAFQSSKGLIQLRDAIDFRPSVPFVSDSMPMIDPDSLISANVEYYLSRADKIYVDKNGNFGYVEGISSVSPVLPPDPNDAMVLYTIRLGAYTFDSEDIVPTIVDNKRYTMRDIGRIEKRVSKLEYYTSLSLLEKDTTDRQIINVEGDQRFKNGFVVDSFYGHSIGAVTHPDYRCSIDKANGRLRPSFKQDNVRLTWNPNSNGTRNVRQSSSLITLDYTQQALIQQPYASFAENVNPYNVFTWTGDMALSPESDEWKETERRPEIVVDQSGTYDSLRYGLDESNVIGTVWNDWQDNWTGVVAQSSVTNVDNDYNSFKKTSTTTLTTTTKKEQARSGIRTSVVPDTVLTQMGDRTVEINFVPFIRSRKIYFRADGLKPNTKLHAFFDNTNVDQFVHQEAYVVYSNRSDAENYINAIQHPDYVSGDLIMTDESGRVTGSFIIPVNSNIKFKTGVRIFSLSDDISNNKIKQSTGAEVAYDARGIIEAKENLVISTRVPRFRREQLGENRAISDTSQSTISTQVDLPRQPLPPDVIAPPLRPPIVIPGPAGPTINGLFQVQAFNSTGGLSVSFNGDSSGNIISGVSSGQYNIVALSLDDYEFARWYIHSGNPIIGGGQDADEYLSSTTLTVTDSCSISANFRLKGAALVESTVAFNPPASSGNNVVQPPPQPWTWLLAPPYLNTQVGAPIDTIDQSVSTGPISEIVTDYTDVPEEYIPLVSPPEDIIVDVVPVNNTSPPTEVTIEAPSDPYEWELHGRPCGVEWRDPLAQSFLIDMPGGAFITSLDLYFKEKDGNIPLTLEIRVMENGIPTPRVVPFSTIKAYPTSIQISDNATAATRFNFEAPVYLLQNVEYCFVLISNSDKYKVWVSEVGGYDVTNPAFRITSQPYIGVMFRSQNASTWNPDQTQDIKFDLNRAVFHSSGSIELNELPLPARTLQGNPFITTSGSKTVVVLHKNHGHTNGSKVSVSGVTAAVNGIPLAEFNTIHVVSGVEVDSYTITVATTNATSSGIGGGLTVAASENKMFDVLNPIIQQIILPNTDLYWTAKTTQGKSLAGAESFGTQTSEIAPFVQVNDATYFNSPQVILSETERVNTSPLLSHSLSLIGKFVSLSNNISPVIDLDRVSLITVSNRIDNPVASVLSGKNVVRNFVPEEASTGGSALAKYITRKVELNDPASALKVFFLANRPLSTDIELYYKTALSSDLDFEALGWEKAEPNVAIAISDDLNNYSEIEYTIGDVVGEIATGTFTAFAIKIVFTSKNSAQVPTLRDFRAIAVT